MFKEWATTDDDLLTAEQAHAVDILRRGGFDVMRQPLFWETVIAGQFGGATTPHKAGYDVIAEIWGRTCRAEIKFSIAFYCRYNSIRGKDWSRPVFKWALPRGRSGKNEADAVILIGRDVDSLTYGWAVPIDAIASDCASITITAPSARLKNRLGRLDRWSAPFDQLLPAFARIAHNRYDAATRRKGIAERKPLPLFDERER